MKTDSMGKNLFSVAFSRLVSLLSSVAVGFVLPKIFSVTDYGYFKIFTLYAVYMALLHFGFVDGLLLRLAGKDYSELEKEKIRSYTRFFVIFELLISVLIVSVGFAILQGEYRFILIMLALNMVFVNVTTYYQFISQAVQRFGEYSAKNLMVSVAKLVFVGILFALYYINKTNVSYRIYLVGLNLLDLAMMLWYVYIYKDISFGKGLHVRSLKSDIVGIFKTGIVLTVAYQVSHLVLALDRQFVNILFPTETFAVYSFAYNIVSMISTMVSSVSIVLLPMLKRRSKELVLGYYKKSVTVISIVTAGALLCYFPLDPFLKWFLPDYIYSLEYISIILPTVLFTSVITVVMFTVEKVFDTSFSFFKCSCAVLALGFITNTAAYCIFKTPQAISYASLVVMAVWFLAEGITLGRRTGVTVYKDFIYLVIISTTFLIVIGFIDNIFLAMVLFGAVFAVLTFALYREMVVEAIKKVKTRK